MNPQLFDWAHVEKEQMNPLFARQVVHTDRFTVARLWLGKGCIVPEHRHGNEQLSTVESGRLKFVLEGREQVVGPGQSLLIPPEVPHSAEALDDVIAVDIFAPVREDWRTGDDAYLRGR